MPDLLYNWVASVDNFTVLFVSFYVYHYFIDRHRHIKRSYLRMIV